MENYYLTDAEIIPQLAEAANEENFSAGADPSPRGYFYDADKLLRETLEPVLKKFLAEKIFYIRHADDSVEKLDASKYFGDVWDYLYGNENSYCAAAELISVSIEKFISRGAWQCALVSTDAAARPHPVLWFGLPDEVPLKYWMLDPCAANSVERWFTETDWSDVLADDPHGCVSYWAAECGINLPDRSKLLDSCPIKIRDDMTAEELRCAVESLYKNFGSKKIFIDEVLA